MLYLLSYCIPYELGYVTMCVGPYDLIHYVSHGLWDAYNEHRELFIFGFHVCNMNIIKLIYFSIDYLKHGVA